MRYKIIRATLRASARSADPLHFAENGGFEARHGPEVEPESNHPPVHQFRFVEPSILGRIRSGRHLLTLP